MDTKFGIWDNNTEVQVHLYDNGITIKSRSVCGDEVQPWSEGITLTAKGLSREGILQFVDTAQLIIGVQIFEQVYNILS